MLSDIESRLGALAQQQNEQGRMILHLQELNRRLQEENKRLHDKISGREAKARNRMIRVKNYLLHEKQELLSKASFLRLRGRILRIETQHLPKNNSPHYIYKEDPKKCVIVYSDGTLFEGYLDDDLSSTRGTYFADKRIVDGYFSKSMHKAGICVDDYNNTIIYVQSYHTVSNLYGIHIYNETTLIKGRIIDETLLRGSVLEKNGELRNGYFVDCKSKTGTHLLSNGFTVNFYKNGKLNNRDEYPAEI